MASSWRSKSMWQAVLLTIALHIVSSVVNNYIWGEVWLRVKSVDGFDLANETDDGEWSVFTTENLKGEFQRALVLPFHYQWQVWLENTFPSRPWLKVQFKDKPISNVDERLEEEIMQRMISEGRVQRSSLRWGNVFIKTVLDFIGGSIIFGALWVPVVEATNFRFDSTKWSLYNFGDTIFGEAMSRIFSISAILAFFAFCVVPVEHRLPVIEAMRLMYSTFWGSVFNIIVPWVATTESFKEGAALGRKQRLLLEQANAANLTTGQNTTVTFVSKIV